MRFSIHLVVKFSTQKNICNKIPWKTENIFRWKNTVKIFIVLIQQQKYPHIKRNRKMQTQ